MIIVDDMFRIFLGQVLSGSDLRVLGPAICKRECCKGWPKNPPMSKLTMVLSCFGKLRI